MGRRFSRELRYFPELLWQLQTQPLAQRHKAIGQCETIWTGDASSRKVQAAHQIASEIGNAQAERRVCSSRVAGKRL